VRNLSRKSPHSEPCHSERSEESPILAATTEILRSAQDDCSTQDDDRTQDNDRTATLPACLGRFAHSQLEVAGLLPIAAEICAGRELGPSHAQRLHTASLPLLAKLVELKRVGLAAADASRVERVVFCPLASLLASHGSAAAVAAARHLLAERLAMLHEPEILCVAVDFAPGSFSRDDLVRCLDELLQRESPRLAVTVGQPVAAGEPWVATLLAVRDAIHATGRFAAWYPVLTVALDQSSLPDGEASGLEVLRAIALARLLLPNDVAIGAPVTTLGAKVALTALDCGASYFGPLAADPQTAAALRLPETEALEAVEP